MSHEQLDAMTCAAANATPRAMNKARSDFFIKSPFMFLSECTSTKKLRRGEVHAERGLGEDL